MSKYILLLPLRAILKAITIRHPIPAVYSIIRLGVFGTTT